MQLISRENSIRANAEQNWFHEKSKLLSILFHGKIKASIWRIFSVVGDTEYAAYFDLEIIAWPLAHLKFQKWKPPVIKSMIK